MLAKEVFAFLVVLVVFKTINGVSHGENADEPRETQVPILPQAQIPHSSAGHLFAAHIHQMTLPNISTNSASSSSSSPHHHSSAAFEEATRTAHLTHSQLLKYYIQRRRQMPNPDIELPKNGQFKMANFEPIVNFFYGMPKKVMANANAMTIRPLGTVEERKAFQLDRFVKHIYDGKPNQHFHIGTLENANYGPRMLYENGRDHFYKFSQEQISDYLSLFEAYNDFYVPQVQKLELVTFKFQRSDFSIFNPATIELFRDLLTSVSKLCKEQPNIENAQLLCVLAHLFTFAVEFHSQISTFLPFKQRLFDGMKEITPTIMNELISFRLTWNFLNEPFDLFLSWLRMTARASWMEESALTIFGTQFAQSKPFGVVINANLSAGAKLRYKFKQVRQSYTNLAKKFILYQKVLTESVENV